MSRNPRQRKARGRSRVGERFEVEVGPVAHGGHCVVRVPAGDPDDPTATRVVFTRHTLPGERVVVEITEGTEGDRFWRGDAVEVLEPSKDRVTPPCPFSGPDRCGGCDFQHVSLPRQRGLKLDVVREQLVRLARMSPEDPLLAGLRVEAVPGDEQGLRWRTRGRFVDLGDGRRGMRKFRSTEVVEVDDCLIESVEPVSHTVRGLAFEVAPGGFWQVHPGAPEVLVDSVLEMLAPQAGESVLDLYAGVGLFGRFLAQEVGTGARLVAVEGDRTAAGLAKRNLAGAAKVRVSAGDVGTVLSREYDEPFDLVVLDPPREGARRAVVEQVVDRAPRAVAYVACDPAALARDVALFAERGYALTALRAFDLFPMTHHVECVALLEKVGA
ncbi:class I SAM-dependent RNA methyltransferase [Nocardioides daphniae]|uniref:23S rRNA methyltransferase n=1 Tax=Nocardioides daphniae TaxID=402297 RepID=A0A4P7UCQ4_9ACTN|nr:methyltransferase [Nocardioides daphniae]QCC77098.1 class I SAM-dependent RNA methyltransferase [Nocardioides daphniae]GGD19591.1 23S rRNA methyltransferase [Nocardioides daphniae]